MNYDVVLIYGVYLTNKNFPAYIHSISTDFWVFQIGGDISLFYWRWSSAFTFLRRCKK